MSRATPSPPSTSATASHKARKRKYTRVELEECIRILGPLNAALPPELPPSPPASRSSSPSPSTKRKLNPTAEHPSPKKQRIGSAPDPALALPPPPPPPTRSAQTAFSSAFEPSEDGEVSEELPVFRTSLAVVSNVPVRRPRRGRPSVEYFDDLYTKYHTLGRVLKHSGFERLLSTHPATDTKYKPLPNPPAPGTPYHKYGHLIARLEHLDALLCFTYAMWTKDYSRRLYVRQNWQSLDSFLTLCKNLWREEDTDDRERAFAGLIHMIEGFIHARRLRYHARALITDDERLMRRLQIEADADEQRRAKQEANRAAEFANRNPVPSMLPSPVSSAGSTPTSAQGTPNASGTPNISAPPPPPPPTQAPPPPPPAPARPPPSASDRKSEQLPPHHITIGVNSEYVGHRRNQSNGILQSSRCLDIAQKSLTLPIMAKHFPRTFARTMYTTLQPTDEHEPDIEDEEGELYWPGQAITGEGLGWLCLMGKAMIMEFGKAYGYKGVEGVILKPEGEDATLSALTPMVDAASVVR